MSRFTKFIRKIKQPFIVNAFHKIYYEANIQYTFLGYPISQCALDLQLYQELIFRTRPSFIIQTGVANGGSIRYFAALLDLINATPDSFVIGVDIQLTEKAKTLIHPRIRIIEGDSGSQVVINQVKNLISGKRGMVILDSNHAQEHVLKELELYSGFVGSGQYLVVEDTNIHGHPVYKKHGPGPLEATNIFLNKDDTFCRDNFWDKNLFSYHQNGWLKKIR